MNDFIDFAELNTETTAARTEFNTEVENILLGQCAWYMQCDDEVTRQRIRMSIIELARDIAMGIISAEVYAERMDALNAQAGET